LLIDDDTAHLHGRNLEGQSRSVLPGAWLIESERPIATLLGSCVAVCLYDPSLRIGGMNHFMLPEMEKRDHADADMLLSGDYAMEALLNAMLGRGVKKTRLQAKAFGGGTIIENLAGTGIGERNVAFAKEWLAREGIPLMASDFLGPWSRKIILEPHSGDVYCRRMGREDVIAGRIAREEAAYRISLVKQPKKADIELF
jgi:chemotaxis protein CheD